MIITVLCFPPILDALYRLARGCAELYGRDDWEMTFTDYLRAVRKEAAPFFKGPRAKGLFKTPSYYAFILAGCAAEGAAVYLLDEGARAFAAGLLGALLLALSYVDYRTRYLPDVLMLMTLLLSLGQAAAQLFIPWQAALAGGAGGFALMWSINALFRLIRKKDGMGFGDIKLTAALGLWTGPLALPYILFLSSFIGLAGALAAALITRSKTPDRFAYGPALALAGWVMLLYGQTH